MAKNTGDNYRKGAVKDRSQFVNPINDTAYKRDTDTGRIIDGKSSGGDFKGVRHEKQKKS